MGAEAGLAWALGVGATFLLAGAVKGVVGLGLPTVAMGLLALWMAPVQAAALLVLPSLATNLVQMLGGPALRALVVRLWPMLLGVVAGTLLGIGGLTGTPSSLGSALLGGVLLGYAAIGLAAPRLRVPRVWERWLALPVGLATGLLTGATGVFVVPAVPYLGALGLRKEELVQALGLSFTVSTLALAAALAWQGRWGFGDGLLPSALAVAPALIGLWLGQRLRNRLDPLRFRRWFFVALAAVGVAMLGKALAGSP